MRIYDMDLILKRIVLLLIGVILSIMVSAAFLIPEKTLVFAEECEPTVSESRSNTIEEHDLLFTLAGPERRYNMIGINIERSLLEKLRNEYPPGTRIRLTEMRDPMAPVPPGTAGTVIAVDDVGTIHMKWDNGRTLGLITGVDSFSKLETEE